MSKNLSDISALIVEDEVFIIAFIEDTLRDAGVGNIETALTLSDAKTTLSQAPRFDVIILDARLPDGDTLELAEELLANGQSVVFHSGTVEPRLVSEFKRAVFCQKPSTPDALLRGVQQSLQVVNG